VYRTTQDVVELRRWAEAHGARPRRDERTGRLLLALPGQCGGCDVGWDEFEPTFLVCHDVFVYDDAPGRPRCFVGPVAEARTFVSGVEAVQGPHAVG
jgi:hypothetical protein